MAIHLHDGTVIHPEKEEPVTKRFQSMEDISDHFLRVDREQKTWMLEAADSICEDIFAVMASLKTARNACITYDTLTSRISHKLWMKILEIGSDCDEVTQTYWVLLNLTEMSRYWTPSLVRASKTLLSETESQEFIKFANVRYEGLQSQLKKVEKTVLTTSVVSMDDLVKNGASVSVSFNHAQTSGIKMNTNQTQPSNDEQTNGSPLPNIDEQLFDQNIAKNKAMDGIFHRAYSGVKKKVVQVKETVVNFVTTCPIWKLAVVFAISILMFVLAIFMRRGTTANITASGVWTLIAKTFISGWVIVKNTTIAVVAAVKGWFEKPPVIVETTAAAA